MGENTLKNRLKVETDTAPENERIELQNFKWGHFSMDDIERMEIRFGLGYTEERLEKELKLEFTPLSLNTGISVEDIYKEIHRINKGIIEECFKIKKQNHDSSRELLAGLTIPIEIERDRLQR